MDRNQLEGNWNQLKGEVKEKFGKLTDDDLEVVRGKRDKLVGKVQERYGISRDEAERRVKEWQGTIRRKVEKP